MGSGTTKSGTRGVPLITSHDGTLTEDAGVGDDDEDVDMKWSVRVI